MISETVVSLLPLTLVLAHLSDAYLRYLAFKNRMTAKQQRNLWLIFAVWGLCHFGLDFLLFSREGITAVTYKCALMLGWIPYLAIFMFAVRQSLWQHIFVFGMSAVWSFSQHNWSSLLVVHCFDPSNVPFFLSIHAILYLLWFLLMLPIERRCFRNVLCIPPLFTEQFLGRCVAVLPLVVLFGPMLLIADGTLIHSWQERLSRIYLPVVFFFLYYYVLTTSNHMYEQMRILQSTQQLKAQLSFLKHHQDTILQSQKKISVLRHDMRHIYRILYAMLQEGDVKGAIDYIKGREEGLTETTIRCYCQYPLVNAALSFYVDQAEKSAIPLSLKVNLPSRLTASEEDFAVLLANLLENAIQASRRQKEDRREISLVIQHRQEFNHGTQCVLELANRYDSPLALDEKGLPATSREGHGLGMASLTIFTEKYNAYTDVTQENGWVRVSMYWEER